MNKRWNLLKTLTFPSALATCVGAGMLAFAPSTSSVRGTPYVYQEAKIFAPWFDGVFLDERKMLEVYRARGLSDTQIWQVYQFLSVLGSRVVFAQKPILSTTQHQAFNWRARATEQLINIRNSKEFAHWKKTMAQDLQKKAQGHSLAEGDFYAYVGLEPHAFQGRSMQHGFVGSLEQSILHTTTKRHSLELKALGPYTPVSQAPQGFVGFISAHDAMTELKQALAEHGVWAVRLPIGSFHKPEDVADLAKRIRHQGKAMEEYTGLSKAMGARGHIFWAMEPSHKPLTNAFTQPLADKKFFIQSGWSSFPHEWMHVVLWVTKDIIPVDQKNPRQALERGISKEGLTARQWDILMKQAYTTSNVFFQHHWRQPAGVPQGSTMQGALAYSVSLQQLPSRYTTAIAAAQVYWLKRPSNNTHVSSWVARRQLADKMLGATQWSEPGMIQEGYYGRADEWLAAAYQGEWAYQNDGARPLEHSIVHMPLEIELHAYRRHWNKFFEELAPHWNAPADSSAQEKDASPSKNSPSKN